MVFREALGVSGYIEEVCLEQKEMSKQKGRGRRNDHMGFAEFCSFDLDGLEVFDTAIGILSLVCLLGTRGNSDENANQQHDNYL